MTPRELLLTQRAELLAAFHAALGSGRSLDELSREVRDLLSEIVQAVEPAKSSGSNLSERELSVVGTSSAMILVRTRLGQLSSRSRAPVLVLGESGVGKRHCARVLHHATYPEGRWLEVDGLERGRELERIVGTLRRSSSAEAEAGMTIYVHELAEAAPEVQAQLARVLDEQTMPLRVIASSGWSLKELGRTGKLRKELSFRFSNELNVPPLRDRKQDILPLAQHFAEEFARSIGAECTTFTPAALGLLCDHSWPGNLNELKNTVERVSTELGPGPVDAEDLPALGERESGSMFTFRLPADGIDLAELEHHLLVQALAAAGNNQSRAATLLGLTRDQIRYRIGKLLQRKRPATDSERPGSALGDRSWSGTRRPA